MHSHIKATFAATRTRQISAWGRPVNPVDEAAGVIICETALLAMEDSAAFRDGLPYKTDLRVVPLDTGMGKSSSTAAFIAAAREADPKFSCAYIAPTIKCGLDFLDMLLTLGVQSTIWFAESDDVRMAEYLKRAGPYRTTDKRMLRLDPIIIVTHTLWKSVNEMVSNHKDRRRDVIFIDEAPDLVEKFETRPLVVATLLDRLKEDRPDWRDVLAAVSARMETTRKIKGQTYTPEALIAPEEQAILGTPPKSDFLHWGSDAEAEEWAELFEFLKCAAKGNCFHSRQDWAFFAFEHKFEPGPGHILLDATSDLQKLVTLMPGLEKDSIVTVPEVDYGQLEILHVDHPAEFTYMKPVSASEETAASYVAWMRSIVLANSAPDDRILVCTHMGITRYSSLIKDWGGRHVQVIYWGGPYTGSNDFKDCNVVFCFGEAHRPGAVSLQEIHGVSRWPLTHAGLAKAKGRYGPSGDYLKPWEGHLLASTKQMAMRGTARNIDEKCRAAPMRLVTSMALGRIAGNLKDMFPGAPGIKPAKGGSSSLRLSPSDYLKRFQALLRDGPGPGKDWMSIKEASICTDIPTDQFSIYLKRAQKARVDFGVTIVSAKDLGIISAGRGKYLRWPASFVIAA